jgi:adenylosuccinate synthase
MPVLFKEHFMPLQVVIGTQWGDEGKGRVVDWFAAQADFNARYNGGDNAGHTVTAGTRIFKLHLIPSGMLHPQVTAVLGNGMVINPRSLFDEMDTLTQAGISIQPERLRISYAAHLITPAHQALDWALEAVRGKESLGTTGRGIGPAYTDKAARRGLRVGDMLGADFCERVGNHVAETNQRLGLYGAPMLDPAPICTQFREYAERIKPYVADTSIELDTALREGKTVLVEAAQGTLLDLDFGTYPFVTSSSTTAAGVLSGLGLGLGAVEGARVIGVAKAFQTRVGSGPFPTELHDQQAERLRGSGANPWDEYGTTTGRPRRVGWLDGVLLRYAVRLNGIHELIVTKLDILSGIETLKICTAYRRDGKIYDDLPLGPADLRLFEPVYDELGGWKENAGAVRKWAALPVAAQVYLERIQELTGIPIRLVSVGAERGQMVEKD